MRVRVRGTATSTVTLYVNLVMPYSKRVNDYTQLGVNYVTYINNAPHVPITLPPRTGWSVAIGPFIWGDGVVQTLPYVPALQTSYQVIHFSWPPNVPCPYLYVTYYINNLYLTQREITPSRTSTGCAYTIPRETLQIVPTRLYYEYARYIKPSGALTIQIAYRLSSTTPPPSEIYISILEPFNSTSIMWTEPFHSQFFIPDANRAYGEWVQLRLLAVADVIYGRVNTTSAATARLVSKLMASSDFVVISLETNRGIDRAVWEVGVRYSAHLIYYGDALVKEPWWQSTALAVLDGIGALLTLVGIVTPDPRIGLTSLTIYAVSHLVRSASAQLRYDGHILEFRRGWADPASPTSVYIALLRADDNTARSLCTTWRLREANLQYLPTISLQAPTQTICMPPRLAGKARTDYKI